MHLLGDCFYMWLFLYRYQYTLSSHICLLFYIPIRVIGRKKINQSTVSTEKRLASLFWYLIASTIDTLQNTINGYEISCIWNSKYNVNVCMIQTMLILYFKNLLFLLTLNCENLAKQFLPLAMYLSELFCVRFV